MSKFITINEIGSMVIPVLFTSTKTVEIGDVIQKGTHRIFVDTIEDNDEYFAFYGHEVDESFNGKTARLVACSDDGKVSVFARQQNSYNKILLSSINVMSNAKDTARMFGEQLEMFS